MGQTLPVSDRAILIVEDEPLIRLDLVDFFEDAGFRVFEADNASVAIALLAAHAEIQIVLTDVQMPGAMDGIRLAHYIRATYPPVFVMVASGAIRPSAADLPVDALFFAKPFDPRSVLNILHGAH